MFLYRKYAICDVGAAENLNVSVPQLREFRCGDRRNLRISSATIGLKIVRFFLILGMRAMRRSLLGRVVS